MKENAGEITPWAPSQHAIKRVIDPLPVPTHCNVCRSTVSLVTNDVIYGSQYGKWPWAYKCDNCDAYVGLHEFTNLPLGTLADAGTREARKRAKNEFNPLWNTGNMTRSEAYKWLADAMGISTKVCHIAMMDSQQCAQVVALCKEKRSPKASMEALLNKYKK